jgi:hypothetical protein
MVLGRLDQRGLRLMRAVAKAIARTGLLVWTGNAPSAADQANILRPDVDGRRNSLAMSRLVGTDELNERRWQYYMDQQVGVYSIVLSISLGVAGLAAASLLYSSTDRSYRALFWVLWFISLLAVAIVYSGMNANVYALPNRTPDVMDIFFPFAMALMEFMLFALLTRPLAGQASPRSVIAAWFGCFGLFSCLACTVILRIRWLFQHAFYDPTLQAPVDRVIQKLYQEFRGAALCALISIAAAALFEWLHALPLVIAYIFTVPITIGFVMGFYSHHEQRTVLDQALATGRTAAPRS